MLAKSLSQMVPTPHLHNRHRIVPFFNRFIPAPGFIKKFYSHCNDYRMGALMFNYRKLQLHGLVDAGNTVIVVEHNMRVAAASDWIIDIGPGAGEKGGRIVAEGSPADVSQNAESLTAKYLRKYVRGKILEEV